MSAPSTTTRDALAELVNGGPLPKNPRTVGGIYERDTAYQRADEIIAAGWNAPTPRQRGGTWRAERDAYCLNPSLKRHQWSETTTTTTTITCVGCGLVFIALGEARIAAAETARNAGEVGVMTREIDGRTWFALETPERDL